MGEAWSQPLPSLAEQRAWLVSRELGSFLEGRLLPWVLNPEIWVPGPALTASLSDDTR